MAPAIRSGRRGTRLLSSHELAERLASKARGGLKFSGAERAALGLHDFGHRPAGLLDAPDRIPVFHELPHRIRAEHLAARRTLRERLQHLAHHALELLRIDLADGGNRWRDPHFRVELAICEHLITRGVVAGDRDVLARALDVDLVRRAILGLE